MNNDFWNNNSGFWNNNSGQPWLTMTSVSSGTNYVPIRIESTAPPSVAEPEPESAVEWLRRRVDETRVGLVA
jgi:hypothetical protein